MLDMLLSLSVSWAVKPMSNADLVKVCLAEVYKAQSIQRGKFAAYSTSPEMIGVSKIPMCKDVKLDFSNVQEKAFTITGELGDQKWSIDDGKNLRHLD